MESIWKLLGHDVVIRRVVDELMTKPSARLMVDGPPGCGKSWLAKSIGAEWEHSEGFAFVAEGDRAMSDRDFFPLGSTPMPLRRTWNFVQDAMMVLSRMSDAALGSGRTISTIADRLFDGKHNKSLERALFLKPVEADYLQSLERECAGQPILLIADNIHWWDIESLHFLKLLLNGTLAQKISLRFLADLRVLAVRTDPTFQAPTHTEYLNSEIYPHFSKPHRLANPTVEKVPEVMTALGCKRQLNQGELAAVANACGGNLALLSRAAQALSDEQNPIELDSEEARDMLDLLIRERVLIATQSNTRVIETLKCASILGIHFLKQDLACLQRKQVHQIQGDLSLAESLGLMELNHDQARFTHETFKTYFYEDLEPTASGVYARLSECLRVSNPGNHKLRATAHAKSGDINKAAGHYICYLISLLRDGRYPEGASEPPVDNLIDLAGFGEVSHLLIEGWKAVLSERPFEAIALFRSFGPTLGFPKILHAELDFLRATSLLASRSDKDRETATKILERWGGFEIDEPELGMRLQVLLIYAYTLEDDKDRARELIERIELLLAEKETIDESVRDSFYTIYRLSDGIYPEEIASHQIKKAVEYFGPKGGKFPRRAIEYFRSLNNYGAVSSYSGRLSDAREALETALRVAEDNPEVLIRDGNFPRSNLIFARFLEEDISAKEALDEQEQAIGSRTWGMTSIFLENNAVAYALLAGENDKAIAICRRMRTRIDSGGEDTEVFLQYLAKQTECLVRYHTDGDPTIKGRWQSLTPLVSKIPYVSRPLYLKRHELLLDAFDSVSPGDATEWDRFPQRSLPRYAGPSWTVFGRGFLLTDVQFWRFS